LVNRMLQSYEDTSRNRCESGWTFSMHHADELLSPNVCKNDISRHLPLKTRLSESWLYYCDFS
jgi:hypothetical protein